MEDQGVLGSSVVAPWRNMSGQSMRADRIEVRGEDFTSRRFHRLFDERGFDFVQYQQSPYVTVIRHSYGSASSRNNMKSTNELSFTHCVLDA